MTYMLTWIKNFDKFEARFRQFGGWRLLWQYALWECCGMASVIDNKVGRNIALSNPNQSVGEFAKVKEELEQNRSLLKEMSENCKERQIKLSWEGKTKKMISYYEQVKGHIETKL